MSFIGLNTRIEKFNEELTTLDGDLSALKIKKKDAKVLLEDFNV